MHLYVGWRVATLPWVARHIPRLAVALVFLVLALGYFLARTLVGFGATRAARLTEIVGSDWVGVLFLTCVALLAADLVTGFGRFLPGIAPQLRTWALAAAAALSLIAFVQAARAPLVHDYEIKLPGLPAASDGTVVVLVSDLHLGSMLDQHWLQARIAQIQALHPDVVILAGDIVEGHRESAAQFVPVLRTLSAPLGVWAVNGNHETYFREGHGEPMLEKAGIRLLQDRWAEVRPGLVLAGVDDLTSRRRRIGHYTEFIDRALAQRPPGAATIFISHTPWGAEQAAADGAGLMLSGHTHNGQIWPFNYYVRLVYPRITGRYDVNGMPLIVTRGMGTWGPRMRLWSRSEIVRITLRAVTSPVTSRQ